MTQQQKLKEVVEATGVCWFSAQIIAHKDSPVYTNPSPSDLNAIIELVVRAGAAYVINNKMAKVLRKHGTHWKRVCHDNAPAEALLNALHESIKDKS